MANPDSQEQYDKTLERYCRLIDEFGNLGGYDIDVKIGTVCSGLNIDNKMLSSEGLVRISSHGLYSSTWRSAHYDRSRHPH